jgi:three-Cys-motif partner protein
MVAKQYDWKTGAKLDEHSKRKLKILREYFYQYLTIRCQIPQQEKFRLSVVDGFSGGGRYKCGTAGSPIIFIEELRKALDRINFNRATQGLGAIEIECLLILNDDDNSVVQILKDNCTPVIAEANENATKLHLQVQYLNDQFESAYPQIKNMLKQGRYRNILFNLGREPIKVLRGHEAM